MDKLRLGQNFKGIAYDKNENQRRNKIENIPVNPSVNRIEITGPKTEIVFDVTKHVVGQKTFWDCHNFYGVLHKKGEEYCSDFVETKESPIIHNKNEEHRLSRNLIYLAWFLEKMDKKVVCVGAGYNEKSFIFASNQNQELLAASILKLKTALQPVDSTDVDTFSQDFKRALNHQNINITSLEREEGFQRALINLKELRENFLSKESFVLIPEKVSGEEHYQKTALGQELALEYARRQSRNSHVVKLKLPYIYDHSEKDLERITEAGAVMSVALDLHAEMQIMQFFNEYDRISTVKMIGISKRPCLKCAAVFSILKEKYAKCGKFLAVEESHGNSVDCWVIPPFIRKNPQLTQEFLGPLYAKYENLVKENPRTSSQAILEDIFTLIEFGFNGSVPQDPSKRSATNSRRHSVDAGAPQVAPGGPF